MKAKTLTMLAGVGLLAGTASADFLGVVWEEVDNLGYADFTVDVFAQFSSGADFLAAVAGTPIPGEELDFTVTGGTYYQNPAGNPFIAPNEFFFALYPSLEYDSFVDIGMWDSGGGTDATATIGLDWSATALTSTNGSWYVAPSEAQGTPLEYAPGDYRVLVARLSVDADAPDVVEITGTARYQYFEDGVAGSAVGGFTFIPAPGVLALLGLAGLAGTRRRR